MPRSRFTAAEWRKIEALNPDDFGLPKRRAKSAVIGTFNTLKLGKDDDDAKHWDYLTNICKRFDLLAVQEVLDDLSGLERLVRGMRGYELLVSDTTGKFPGARRGLTERLDHRGDFVLQSQPVPVSRADPPAAARDRRQRRHTHTC